MSRLCEDRQAHEPGSPIGVDEWDIYQTDDVAAWMRELQDSNPKIANVKELRPGSSRRSEVRILFVFGPWRSAILLVVGDKAGSWNRWCARMIPRAEQLYEIPEGTGSGGRQPVTSYTKWDRDAYTERADGPEEAERRRKALMARQSGQRLADERKQRGLTQAQLAATMGVTQGRVSPGRGGGPELFRSPQPITERSGCRTPRSAPPAG